MEWELESKFTNEKHWPLKHEKINDNKLLTLILEFKESESLNLFEGMGE